MKEFYPVFLQLKGQNCVVVGGGQVAYRKVMGLLSCHARVQVVSPALVSELQALVEQKQIEYLEQGYDHQCLHDAFLVISCSNDREVNKQVARDCLATNILVNVVDVPALCSFFVPAVVSRGHLSIAVSTEGKSPVLARKIRQDLEKRFPREWAGFVAFLGDLREEVMSQVSCPGRRKRIFTLLAEEDFFHKYSNLSEEEALKEARKIISDCEGAD